MTESLFENREIEARRPKLEQPTRSSAYVTMNFKCVFLSLNLSTPCMFSVKYCWLYISSVRGFYTVENLNPFFLKLLQMS